MLLCKVLLLYLGRQVVIYTALDYRVVPTIPCIMGYTSRTAVRKRCRIRASKRNNLLHCLVCAPTSKELPRHHGTAWPLPRNPIRCGYWPRRRNTPSVSFSPRLHRHLPSAAVLIWVGEVAFDLADSPAHHNLSRGCSSELYPG